MPTVPAGAAAVLLAARPDLRAAISSCGKGIGHRIEVDIDAVDLACPGLGTPLRDFADASAHLWQHAASSSPYPADRADGAPGGQHDPAGADRLPYVLVRRTVCDHRQATGKANRADLVAVYEELTDISVLADLVEELTAEAPDVSVLTDMLSVLTGTVAVSSPGELTATVSLDGRYAFPDLLGGVAWTAEVRRRFTFTTRQAAWRDRRVRRLSRVQVAIDELWADPAAYQQQLPGHG
jgi:hypothetical protein